MPYIFVKYCFISNVVLKADDINMKYINLWPILTPFNALRISYHLLMNRYNILLVFRQYSEGDLVRCPSTQVSLLYQM